MSFTLSANETNDVSKIREELTSKFSNWDKKQQKQFNRAYIKVLENWSWGTNYKDSKINEHFSFINFDHNYLDLIFSTAHATAQDSYLICNYGGWMSSLDKDGKCLAPWTKKLRKDETLADFGPFYTGKYSCGKGKFRCNPTVFGGGKDGKGICVVTKDTDPNQATSDCLSALDKVAHKSHLEELIADPEKSARYIAMAAETIRYCNDYEGTATFCEELINAYKFSTNKLINCIEGQSLYKYLPNVISPFNEVEINEIAKNLASDFSAYQAELEKRQLEALAKNAEIIKKGIKSYSESDKTKLMIKKLRRNITKCIADSCDKISSLANKDKKPGYKSVAYCARYVKYGMLGSKNYLKSYPNFVNAVNAGHTLKNAGFSNLMDNPSFSSITPENAPIGSVIVYRKVGAKGGRPGHIEVKTAENEYISDFKGSKPTRVGGMRVPIGIYIKVPNELKKELVEVPEN